MQNYYSMKNIEKIIEIDGHKLNLILHQDSWWIAIKPICQLLDIDYNHHSQYIKRDIVLSKLLTLQKVLAADNKNRLMNCLPEKYLYIWLLSIRTKSESLHHCKLKCYGTLFDFLNNENTNNQSEKSKIHFLDFKKETKSKTLQSLV